MRCDGCKNWTTARVTRYGDGSEVCNWKAPAGKGRCSVLDIDTPEAFGCTSHAPLDAVGALTLPAFHHIQSNWKNGAPWQHHVVGPCPDCRGLGSNSGVCYRCAGTGKVRYYDDGYIGEEQTRLHPKEKDKAEPLRCRNCKEIVDVKWKACPMCGTRLEPVAETEYVDGLGNAGGQYANGDARRERADDLREDIDAMNERNSKIEALRRMTVENGCTEPEAATAKEMAERLDAVGR